MSEIVFYDQTGRPVAYCGDGEHIYLYSGRPVVYIREGSIYAYAGTHLGWFEDGWVRDHRGDAAFFTEGASGGPMKPMRQLRPLKGLKGMRPMKGMRQTRPARPSRSRQWSRLSLSDFFAQ